MPDIVESLRHIASESALEWPHDQVQDVYEAADEIERLREENRIFRKSAKICEGCDGPTMEEVESLRDDAERYRWLRLKYDPAIWDMQGEGDKLDAAIDAARKQDEKD